MATFSELMMMNVCPKAFSEIRSPVEIPLDLDWSIERCSAFTVDFAKLCICKPGMCHRKIQQVAYERLWSWARGVRKAMTVLRVRAKDPSEHDEKKD